MGAYVNPGNWGFRKVRNGEYVDKSGLISLTNSALDQIRNRNHPKILESYGGPVLLVGITYDAKSKAHVATIERLRKE